MSSKTLSDLFQQVNSLTTDEQLRLAAYLVERAREACPPPTRHRSWHEMQGSIRARAVGEDAQDWVSRTRRESDERSGAGTNRP